MSRLVLVLVAFALWPGAHPLAAVQPTAIERLLARAEPALVEVSASAAVAVVWDEAGKEPRRYGPWTITRRGEGAIVAGSGMVATASSVIRLADPVLLQPLIEERFLREVAEAWRRDATARGASVDDESLREGLRRLRRLGVVRLDNEPAVTVQVVWNELELPATVTSPGSAHEPVALVAISAEGPWPSLPPATKGLTAGTRVALLERRAGGPPALADGVVSRFPGVDRVWATDLAIDASTVGAPLVVGEGEWVGVALDRLEGHVAFGVSWVAAPSAQIAAAPSRLDTLWDEALEASWEGEAATARAALEEILAIQEGHTAARRRLGELGATAGNTGSLFFVVLVVVLGVLLVAAAASTVWLLRRRARREMMEVVGSRPDPRERLQ